MGIRFLALGDSYTIGEGVEPGDRWPERLAALLRGKGLAVEAPEIVARTGWTTADLMAGMDQAAPSGRFDLVSLLIGVNDQYGGVEAEEYRAPLRALLDRAVRFAGGEPRRVIVLSIPDWSVSPFALGRDLVRIAAEIELFNAIGREETEARGARHVDITPASRTVQSHWTRPPFAPDGLHPSGVMHAEWARLALPHALAALGRPGTQDS